MVLAPSAQYVRRPALRNESPPFVGPFQDEFAAATMAGKLADQSAEEMKRNFDLFDENKDGFVTAKEIEKLCGGMDPVAAKALILEVDKNSDGKIDFMEWLEAVRAQRHATSGLWFALSRLMSSAVRALFRR